MKNKMIYKVDEETFNKLKSYIIFTDLYDKDPETKSILIRQDDIRDLILASPEILQMLPEADFSKDLYVLTEVLIKKPVTRLYSLAYQKDLDLQFALQVLESSIVKEGERVLTNLFNVICRNLSSNSQVFMARKNTSKLKREWRKSFFSDRDDHRYIMVPQKDGSVKKIKVGLRENSEEIALKKFSQNIEKQGEQMGEVSYSREYDEEGLTELTEELRDYMIEERLVPILTDFIGEDFSFNFVKKLMDLKFATDGQESEKQESDNVGTDKDEKTK